MKQTICATIAVLLFSTFLLGQKGIDPQTDKIKTDGNKTTRTNDVSRSWNWGSGKTRVRNRLENPYRMNSRRDILIETIIDLLSGNQLIVDQEASRLGDGIIVTQPYVFAKGAVTAQNELNRVAIVPISDISWTRGRYALTIEVQSIDGIQNKVYVTAKTEGRSNNGLISEWTTLQSSGLIEDSFLSKLIEVVTGISPDPSQKVDPK